MAKKSTPPTKIERPVFECDWKNALDSLDFNERFPKDIFQDYIVSKRWYGGKVSTIKNLEIIDFIKLSSENHNYFGVLIEINYEESFFQNYFITLAFMLEHELDETSNIIGAASFKEGPGYLVDALFIEDFRKLWFDLTVGTKPSPNVNLTLNCEQSIKNETYVSSKFMGGEQSNTSIIYNEKYVMKFFRRIFIGVNPDYEINKFLTEQQGFTGTPPYRGSANMSHYKDAITLTLMQELVPNKGDAWTYFNDLLLQAYQNLERKKVDISRLPSVPLFTHLPIHKVPHE